MMPWQFLADNLPHATATLNATATVLLVLGLINIRRGRARKHKQLMLWALGVSGLFLLLYLFHKLALYQATGEPNTRFPTDPAVVPDAARYTYYGILGTHLVLAIFVPFLALRAVHLAMKGRIVAHKRWVKFAYPIWMYVSVTGVLVYVMLYHHHRLFGA
jgi:putative membrane protein